MQFTTRLIFFIVMMSFAAIASARNYIVEIIVFERNGTTEQGEEFWRPGSNQVTRRTSELQVLERIAKRPSTLSATSRLKRLEGSLRSSGNRVIQSARWVLNGRTYQNASTFNLNAGNLKAFLKIYKTSLIFADLDMGLIASAPQDVEQLNTGEGLSNTVSQYSPPAPLYFINEKRRLKFKEIHYFDHPKFGAILGVWPAG